FETEVSQLRELGIPVLWHVNQNGKCSNVQIFLHVNNIFQFCCNIETVTSSSFIYVNESKTWSEAQSYCREHYTDLASVRNQAENDQIENMNQNRSVWIGLYRDSWKWSDGSPTSFTYWNNNEPNGDYACAVIHNGRWEDYDCDTTLYFVCEIGEL
uniref:C-type lectin domain-containing protein n=1 Tax=Dicentrarchus labrax TaxID=13489 RepID=A0A8C4F7R3_DICLA